MDQNRLRKLAGLTEAKAHPISRQALRKASKDIGEIILSDFQSWLDGPDFTEKNQALGKADLELVVKGTIDDLKLAVEEMAQGIARKEVTLKKAKEFLKKKFSRFEK